MRIAEIGEKGVVNGIVAMTDADWGLVMEVDGEPKLALTGSRQTMVDLRESHKGQKIEIVLAGEPSSRTIQKL